MVRAKLAATLLLCVVAACGSVTRPVSQRSPAPSPSSALTLADLRYALLGGVGPVWYCSPDLYPIERPVSDADVQARLAAARAQDLATYEAILRHHGLREAALTAADRMTVYRDLQDLQAVRLVPDGGVYRFDYTIRPSAGGTAPGTRVTGTVDPAGRIRVESRAPHTVMCPICLAAGTAIAGPGGDVLVELLRPGAIVWSRDAAGTRVAEPVVATGSTPVPASHLVVRLMLADGRQTRVSPGHPTVVGRRVGDLRPGDEYDGSVVVAAAREAYAGGATFDLLPAGPTGIYWADGIPLRSTLTKLAG
jgi:hypothetical protein